MLELIYHKSLESHWIIQIYDQKSHCMHKGHGIRQYTQKVASTLFKLEDVIETLLFIHVIVVIVGARILGWSLHT